MCANLYVQIRTYNIVLKNKFTKLMCQMLSWCATIAALTSLTSKDVSFGHRKETGLAFTGNSMPSASSSTRITKTSSGALPVQRGECHVIGSTLVLIWGTYLPYHVTTM